MFGFADGPTFVGNELFSGRPHMKFVLVNVRTPRPESFLRVVLRANRRKLPARAYHASFLLRSQVLSRSLQARGFSTQRTCEGIVTTMQNTNRAVRGMVWSRISFALVGACIAILITAQPRPSAFECRVPDQ